MALVSFEFPLFVGALLLVYFRLSRRGQNGLLLVASLGFSAIADVRAAVLLLLSTFVDFVVARRLAGERPDAERRATLFVGVTFDVLLLACFKYWPELSRLLGAHGVVTPPHPFVPLGLSFYALARMTHTLDVYFRLMEPCESFLEFALFASFFPTLRSGPIERARTFLPQVTRARTFSAERARGALFLVLTGLFKKVYIADTCAPIVKTLFDPGENPNGLETLLGVYAYAIQLYGDFAGYSDIARGTALLFGIEVTRNFRAPYLATNLSDYWKRWHVSLSSFLDDYVFAPTSMVLRERGTLGVVLATWVTFFVSALWHGTGVTFLAWGAVHAAGLTVYVLTRKRMKRLKKRVKGPILGVLGTLVTFHTVCFAYLFFRADGMKDAFETLRRLGRPFAFTARFAEHGGHLAILVTLLLAVDVATLKKDELWVFSAPTWLRAVCYAVLLFCVVRLHGAQEAFVYAQF